MDEPIYVIREVVENAISEETTDGARLASELHSQPTREEVSTRLRHHGAWSKAIHETATFPLRSMKEEHHESSFLEWDGYLPAPLVCLLFDGGAEIAQAV